MMASPHTGNLQQAPGVQYPEQMSLAEARALFFARSGLGQDGGYGARWVKVESKPFPVYFPNTSCRVAAAKLHDLHHVATEYGVDWTGEAEIAGWEIASGCGRYGWAWILNLGAFTIGLFRSPRRMFRAFARGRQTPANLYHDAMPDESLALVDVGTLRRRLGLTAEHAQPAGASDIVCFVLWAVIGVTWHALFGALGLAAVVLVLSRLHWV